MPSETEQPISTPSLEEVAEFRAAGAVLVSPASLFALVAGGTGEGEDDAEDDDDVDAHPPILPLARALHDATRAATGARPVDDARVLAWLADLAAWNAGASSAVEDAARICHHIVRDARGFLGLDPGAALAMLGMSEAVHAEFFPAGKGGLRYMLGDPLNLEPLTSYLTNTQVVEALLDQVPRVFRRVTEVAAWLDGAADLPAARSASGRAATTWRDLLTPDGVAAVLAALRAHPSDLVPVDEPRVRSLGVIGLEAVTASREHSSSPWSDRAHDWYSPKALRRAWSRSSRARHFDEEPHGEVRVGLLAQLLQDARRESSYAAYDRQQRFWRAPQRRDTASVTTDSFDRQRHAEDAEAERLRPRIAEAVAKVRWWLALSDQEIADIVGDDPAPALTPWLDGSATPDFASMRRLEQLAQLAGFWPRRWKRDQLAIHAAMTEPVEVERQVTRGRRAETVTEQILRRELLFMGRPGIERAWADACGDDDPIRFGDEWTGPWVSREERVRSAVERERRRRVADFGLPRALASALPQERRQHVEFLLARARELAGGVENGEAVLAALEHLVATGGAKRAKRGPRHRSP
jgi:hypothetical protein